MGQIFFGEDADLELIMNQIAFQAILFDIQDIFDEGKIVLFESEPTLASITSKVLPIGFIHHNSLTFKEDIGTELTIHEKAVRLLMR